jgi:uncharacterized protein with ParB-like and HNH nuclease domain
MNFKDIEKYPYIGYQVNVNWEDLLDHIARYLKNYKLQMCPDFQRGHVWTFQQQTSYIEYMLKCPASGANIILFNHPHWMTSFEGDFVLVDGLQRLTAALGFMNNEIPAYGTLYKDFEGRLGNVEFIFQISNLKSRTDILKWYVKLNNGGTPHSTEEIERVEALIKKEI